MTRARLASTVAWLGAAAACARVVVDAVRVLRADQTALARRLPDDAFYYLGVARNIAGGHGTTFDGRHPTNGFQPLWQAVDSALAVVFSGSALIRASLLVGMALVVLAAIVAARAAQLGPVATSWMLVVVTSPPVWQRMVDGMETPVVAVTAAALSWALVSWATTPTPPRAALVGAATGALALARLSAVPVLVIVPAAMVWRAHRRHIDGVGRDLRAAAAAASPFGAAWIAWSLASVGTAVPQSAILKARWSSTEVGTPGSWRALRKSAAALSEELWRQVRAITPIWDDPPTVVRRVAIIATVAVVAGWVSVAVRRSPTVAMALLAPVVVVGRFVLEAVVQPAQIAPWYGAGLYLPTAMFGAVAGRELVRRASAVHVGRTIAGRRLAALAAGAVFTASAAAAWTRPANRPNGDWGAANREAAIAARRWAPNDRIGAYDAGVVGWIDPGAVNLDGLMREPSFVARSRRATSTEVVRTSGVTLLVGRMAPNDRRIPPCSRRVWSSPTVVTIAGKAMPVSIWRVDDC